MITTPNWANSTCANFFKTGDIQGAERQPLGSDVSDLLKQQTHEAFDAFQAADDGPSDLMKPNPGHLKLRENEAVTEVTFSGDKQAGEFTQLHQEFPDNDQSGVMFAKVTITKDEMRIFNAAIEGNDRIFMGQVIDLNHPELSYNIALGSL